MKNSLVSRFLCFVLSHIGKAKPVMYQMPKKVNQFKLIKSSLRKNFKDSDVYFGKYKSLTGKSAIGKYWSGDKNNIRRMDLNHEISMYQLLWKTIDKNPNLLNHHVTPPKLLGFIRNDHESLLLLEDISSGSKKLKVLTQDHFNIIMDFLKKLDKHMTKEKESRLFMFTKKTYMISFFWHFLTAMAYNYKIRTLLLKCFWMFYLGIIPSSNWKLRINHRDIHKDNIFIRNNKIYLIDYEYCVLTSELYDLACYICYQANPRSYFQKVVSSMSRNVSNLLRSFSLYYCVLNLGVASTKDKDRIRSERCLNSLIEYK